jgi:hypothetical protein
MTINVRFQGINLVAEYNFEPAQIQTFYDPGFDESFELVNVHTEHGDDIGPIFDLSEYLVEMLEEAIRDGHHDKYSEEYPED